MQGWYGVSGRVAAGEDRGGGRCVVMVVVVGGIACAIGVRFWIREVSTGADARIWVKVNAMTRTLTRFKLGLVLRLIRHT